MIGLLLLLLVLLAALLLWQSAPKNTSTTNTVVMLGGSGATPRGPVRLNISDNAYDRHHASLSTGLSAAKVRKDSKHIAYIYRDQLNMHWNGQPAVVLGFKDHSLAGKSTVDYGHIATKDGKHVVAFESVAPVVVNGNTRTLTARFTGLKGLKGTHVAKLKLTTEKQEEKKNVRFTVL